MGAHAKVSPSAAGRWMRCPGSVALSEGIEEVPSAYAEEGTLAHKVASDCLESGTDPDQLGKVDKEMVESVQMYLDFCRGLGPINWIEQRLDLSHLIPDSFGTADFIAISGTELIVVDLKYGKGVRVWAEGNRQLLIYALGAYHMLDLLHKIDSIRMVIVQPRLDHIDEASILVADLLDFGSTVKEAAERASQPNAALVPGLEQCQWCRAKAICKARAAANLQAAMDDFGPLPAGDKLTLEEIGGLLPKLDDIKAWATDLKEYALTQAMAGNPIAGYKLVRGRSNRKWKSNAAETLETLPEAADLIEKKIIGIVKAEKLLGKTHPVFTELTIKPKGKPTLVSKSDRRKPVEPEGLRPTAAEEFSERIEDVNE